jgi:2-keto-4-pentenoate hydratase
MSTARTDPRILRGMHALLELRRSRLEAGETPIGWKVGFGAPAALERLGIDAPLVGFLTDRTVLPAGAIVDLAGWTRPAVEPEIAVYLGSDLGAGADRATARAAIAAVGPAIELVDIHFSPDDVAAILGDGIFHRHVILGRRDTARAGGVLDGLVGRITNNGVDLAPVDEPQALTGDLIEVVRHVADLLAALGERLRAGELIIMGSIVPAIAISGDTEISYTLDPLDTIAVKLMA